MKCLKINYRMAKSGCFSDHLGMNRFGSYLTQHLEAIEMTKYRLHKLSGCPESTVVNIVNGKRRATDDFIDRIATVPELNIDVETLKAWRLLDEYKPGEIRKAFELLADIEPERMASIKKEAKKRMGK